MTYFRDKVAAVTGAASGIGQALAIELSRRGARVAISDIDEPGLGGTAAVITASGGTVHSQCLDVSDRAAVADYAQDVGKHYGVIHQLYNNAGIAVDSLSVLTTDYPAYERTMAINLWGVINGTKEFLPHLIASGAGHLVNISSLNGIMGQAGASAYCASKFAVRGFTESVRAEMIRDRHAVHVTVVHPGGVRTNIATASLAHAEHSGARLTQADRDRIETYNARLLKMPPPRAATIILDGTAAKRSRIVVGGDARVVDALVRLAPNSYPKMAAWLDRRLFGPPETPVSAVTG
jgi:NAD(P)-dependent dehydrogenase (short-subunit alcohol dehydrogenase family)